MVWKRGGWLSVVFLGEMLTSTAMGYLQSEIERAVVLAMFLPLIISSGGNSGSQAATLIVRSLALTELRLRDWWRVFARELRSGLTLGAWLGFIGFVRITVWQVVDRWRSRKSSSGSTPTRRQKALGRPSLAGASSAPSLKPGSASTPPYAGACAAFQVARLWPSSWP